MKKKQKRLTSFVRRLLVSKKKDRADVSRIKLGTVKLVDTQAAPATTQIFTEPEANNCFSKIT